MYRAFLFLFCAVFAVSGNAVTISVTVSSGSDDAEELISDGTVTTTNDALNIVFDEIEVTVPGKGKKPPTTETSRVEQEVGIRFQNVSIPANATITSAYIQFTVEEATDRNTKLVVHAEDIGDSPAFSASNSNISNRTKTTSSLKWQVDDWDSAGDSGTAQRTIDNADDLTEIVQEVVDRGDWSSGNAMTFILTADNGCNSANQCGRIARSYEDSSSDAPTLVVEYDPPAAAGPDHIRIEHDGQGLTCALETITMVACADTDCSTRYTDGISGNLTYGATSSAFNISSGSSETQVLISQTTPATIGLGATSLSPATSSGTRCFAGATETCNLEFVETGFVFSTSTNPADQTIGNQTAGTSFSTYLLALTEDDTGTTCAGAFSGSVPINLGYECINPTTCSSSNLLSVNSSTLSRNDAGASIGYTSVNLTFDVNGAALLQTNYEDVGSIRLHAEKTLSSPSLSLSATSNSFVVRPDHFDFAFVGNPAAADETGGVFKKAGEAFTVTLTAQSSNDNTTPNFGNETTPEGLSLSQTLIAPSGGSSGTLGGSTSVAGSSFTSGESAVNDLTWSEVGIIQLTASIADNDYLGTGTLSSTSGNIGRFVPDRFELSDSQSGQLNDSCTSFSYTGQPISSYMGAAPGVLITAKNLSGDTTVNYRGAYAKLQASDITRTLPTADQDQNGLDSNPLPLSATWGTATLNDLDSRTPVNDGIFEYLSGSDQFTYTRSANALLAPFSAKIPLQITAVTDSDGVAGTGLPVTVYAQGTQVRYGRAYADDVSGTFGLAGDELEMPIGAQYYDGANWINNTADSCSSFSYTKTDTDLQSSVSPSSPVSLSSGAGNLTISIVDPLTDPGGQTRIDTTWDAWLESPSATAFFGANVRDNRIIFWRETE